MQNRLAQDRKMVGVCVCVGGRGGAEGRRCLGGFFRSSLFLILFYCPVSDINVTGAICCTAAFATGSLLCCEEMRGPASGTCICQDTGYDSSANRWPLLAAFCCWAARCSWKVALVGHLGTFLLYPAGYCPGLLSFAKVWDKECVEGKCMIPNQSPADGRSLAPL